MLGLEPVADAEVGVDVLPARREPLQLRAQLANEDVDRAVAVRHRVAPDALVDLLALDHPAGGLGEHLHELELAPGQLEAVAGDERLELVGADLDLAGDDRALLLADAAAAAAADDGLDPRHHLLGVRRLRDPVVGAEAQAADPLGDGRALGADDHPEVGEHPADALEELPAERPEHRDVDQDRVELHRHQLLGRHVRGVDAVLPAGGVEAPPEHVQEAAVVVDYGETDCPML